MPKIDIRKNIIPEGYIIPLKYDFMLPDIFNNKENIIIVENFLSLYLKIPVEKIKGHVEIKSRNLPINSKKNKNKQVDLLLDLDGETINIELTNWPSEGVKERNLVYAAEVHGKQLKYADNSYKKIFRTLQICLNDFKCNNECLIDTYYLRNKEGKTLSEKFQIDYVDLVNAKEKRYNEDEEKIARFCRAILCDKREGFIEELGDIMEKEAKDKLVEEVDKYSRDDEVVALYSAYSREELERNTYIIEAKELGYNEGKQEGLNDGLKKGLKKGLKEGMKEGRKEGIKEGIKEGHKQGIIENRRQIAKKMLEENLDISIISKITGLNKEEISDLK